MAACIVLPRDRAHLDSLVSGLKPELEHTIVPLDFIERDVQATIDKAAGLPWVLSPDQAVRDKHILKRLDLLGRIAQRSFD